MCNELLKAVCSKCASLAMHSNIIRELQNNSLIMKSKITINVCIMHYYKTEALVKIYMFHVKVQTYYTIGH